VSSLHIVTGSISVDLPYGDAAIAWTRPLESWNYAENFKYAN